ncbi:gamma-glutamyl-gamma-aminobutyrate hydrolase family protein [bacterium]|nr:gamma-glutamyl-gamma-aminobutyrate hydrolase family protein [bacterium]
MLVPEENPFLPACYDLINFCVNTKVPVFASCFGFQMAVVAFGGEIIHQEKDFEMGTLPIYLDTKSKVDMLFKDTPDGFYAVSVHKQKAVRLPENCEQLAQTDQCIHAFKVKGAPFWGFQFHPEVSRAHLVERLGIYRDQYTEDAGHFQQVIDNSQETPESALLVKKFVDRVLVD